MRRPGALLLLIVTVWFQVEPVFGEARDGSVHHEQPAEAWIHAHDGHRGQWHDRQSAGRSSSEDKASHGESHDPGSSSDHCSHLHGIAIVALPGFDLLAAVSSFDFASVSIPSRVCFKVRSPPPR